MPCRYGSFRLADGLKQLFAALIFLQRVSVGFIPLGRHFRLEAAAPITSCPGSCATKASKAVKTIQEWYIGGSSNAPATRFDQQDWVDWGAPLFWR